MSQNMVLRAGAGKKISNSLKKGILDINAFGATPLPIKLNSYMSLFAKTVGSLQTAKACSTAHRSNRPDHLTA